MDKVLLVTFGNGDRECYVGKHALRDLHVAFADIYRSVEIRKMSITCGYLWANGVCVGRYETLLAMNVSTD